jgi:hypothetical protein
MALAARTSNRRRSNKYSLYLVERHFLGAPIVQLGCPRARVVRHLRGAFERPAVFEVGGDARRTNRMIADLRRELGRPHSSLNHRISVRLGQRFAGELAGRAAVAMEQERFWIVRKP